MGWRRRAPFRAALSQTAVTFVRVGRGERAIVNCLDVRRGTLDTHRWSRIVVRGSVSNECRPMTVIDNNKKNGGGAKLTSSLTDCFVKRAVRKCLAVMRQKLTINRKVLDNCSFCVELWRIERMWASGRKVVGNGKVTTSLIFSLHVSVGFSSWRCRRCQLDSN